MISRQIPCSKCLLFLEGFKELPRGEGEKMKERERKAGKWEEEREEREKERKKRKTHYLRKVYY